MNQLEHKVSKTTGAAPGAVIHVGQKRSAKVKIDVFAFNRDSIRELKNVPPSEVKDCIHEGEIAWINVDGVHDTQIVEEIGAQFELHPLVLEDIVNTQERPKIENFGSYLYFVMNMGDLDPEKGIVMEQVSIVFGKNFILSFQEDPDDIFDPIRKRLRIDQSKVRSSSADYLTYLLLDAVVDRYFLILEHLGEKIDEVEEELMGHPTKKTLNKVFDLKRELVRVRRSVWPMREIVSNMQRGDSDLMNPEHEYFLRDFYDHILRVIDTVETYRDSISGMVDMYLSHSSIKMNEIMQVLTVISTIFIPLTFVTGFYGMNFDFMPELHSSWSYPVVILLMGLMVVGQLVYFRRKRWL